MCNQTLGRLLLGIMLFSVVGCTEVLVPKTDRTPPEVLLLVGLPDGSWHLVEDQTLELSVDLHDEIRILAVTRDPEGVAYAHAKSRCWVTGSSGIVLGQGPNWSFDPVDAVLTGNPPGLGIYWDPAIPGQKAFDCGVHLIVLHMSPLYSAATQAGMDWEKVAHTARFTVHAQGMNCLGAEASSAQVIFRLKKDAPEK